MENTQQNIWRDLLKVSGLVGLLLLYLSLIGMITAFNEREVVLSQADEDLTFIESSFDVIQNIIVTETEDSGGDNEEDDAEEAVTSRSLNTALYPSMLVGLLFMVGFASPLTQRLRAGQNNTPLPVLILGGAIIFIIFVLVYQILVGALDFVIARERVPDEVTLGQILLFVPALFGGYKATKQTREQQGMFMGLLAGIVVGLLTTIPVLLVMALNTQLEVRDMFVNINRDWIEIITFDNRRDLMRGTWLLLTAMGVAGLIGGAWSQIPEDFRKSVFFGLGLMLVVGVMGETVRLVSQEIFPRDILDIFFKRNVMLWHTGLALFIGGTIFSMLSAEVRRTIIFGLVAGIAGIGISNLAFALPENWSTLADIIDMIFNPVVIVAIMLGAMAGRFYLLYQPDDGKGKNEARLVQSEQGRRAETIVLVVILLVAPWLVGRALSDVMVTVGLFVLMGLGLNVAIGLAGLLDLGYVTNYAVGAYVMGVLISTGPQGRGPEWMNFWVVLPITLLAAMFAGFFFAVPVLKMRGDYLAIATLGFGEIIGRLANSDAMAPLIGGAQGVLHVPKPVFFGVELVNPEQLYYLVLAGCLLTLVVSIRLNNSRTGRQWMAIREDEDAAAAMGINVPLAKLLAFTISAATGGVAGAIFAAKIGSVFPNSFLVLVSINVLSLIIVGGMGSNPGIVLGAIVLMGMPELLREFSEYRWLLYGALLVWMMINRPEGLWPSQVRRRELSGNGPPEPATAQAVVE